MTKLGTLKEYSNSSLKKDLFIECCLNSIQNNKDLVQIKNGSETELGKHKG